MRFIITFFLAEAAICANFEKSDPLSMSMGGLCVVLPGGSNPAWLAGFSRREAAISAMNLYDTPGLYCGDAAVSLSFPSFGAGSGVSALSMDSIYREIEWAGGAGITLGRIRIGAAVNVSYMAFEGDYGSEVSPGFIAGVSLRLKGPLHASAAIHESGCLAAGMGYLGKELEAGLEFEYEEGFPLTVRFGQEFMLFDCLAVRAGMSTEPLCFSFGIGLFWKGVCAESAIRTHLELGLNKSAGLRWKGPRKR